MSEVYAELWNLKKICSQLEEIWNNTWEDRGINLKDKKKICIEKFFEKLLDEYSRFSYILSLKLLRILKESLKEINGFSKQKLTKIVNRKKYYPELSDELINKLYKKLLSPQFSVNSIIEASTPELTRMFIFLKINFILKKPFITKDDDEFYMIENPICKDKVFKIPMIKASSWKGVLRYAAMRCILKGVIDEKIKKRIVMLRLFGTEKDSIEDFLNKNFEGNLQKNYRQKIKEIYSSEEPKLRGRLNFFATFFENIGLDVIAPHDRKTRTVTTPILMEVVPENTKGEFYLLYYPFDLLEKLYSERKDDAIQEIIEDWNVLKEIISDMLEKYGFGAKTSNGYGIAKIEKIEANGKDCGINWSDVLEVIKDAYGK